MARQDLKPARAEVRSKRDDVFAAAAHVFLEKGFHGATMAEIARQAGVATGTLYNLFAGKEQLYLAMVEQKVDEFLLFMQMTSMPCRRPSTRSTGSSRRSVPSSRKTAPL